MSKKVYFDWRLFCAVPGKTKLGGLFKKEEDIIIKGILPPFYYDKIKISFGIPNACALFLGNAYKLYNIALDIRGKSLNKIKQGRLQENLVYAYFEKIMGSILFSFCSIESFANFYIPDDHYHYKQKEKLFLAESKKTIERWEPIEVKLCEILPEVLKIDCPKGFREWQDYRILKNFRDRIVHLKTTDQKPQPEQDSIWSLLYKKDLPCFPTIAKRLIGFYYERKKEIKPPWFDNIPKYIKG